MVEQSPPMQDIQDIGVRFPVGENKSLKQVVTANSTDKRSATDVGVTCPLR